MLYIHLPRTKSTTFAYALEPELWQFVFFEKIKCPLQNFVGYLYCINVNANTKSNIGALNKFTLDSTVCCIEGYIGCKFCNQNLFYFEKHTHSLPFPLLYFLDKILIVLIVIMVSLLYSFNWREISETYTDRHLPSRQNKYRVCFRRLFVVPQYM